jgi:hypothetical protein
MATDPAEQAANLEPDRELETEREPDEEPTFTPPPLREDDDTGDDGDEHREPDEQTAETNGGDGVTPEQLEAAAKKTATSFKTYTNAVNRNYDGLPVALVECPLCPDQHKGFVDAHAAGYVPQEIQEAVKMYFGIAREQDYAASPYLHRCSSCEGKGKVSTGSTVPEHATIRCETCHGKGYEGTVPGAPTNGIVETGPTVFGHEMPVTQAFDDVDEWDEPRILPDGRENPNFGKMPNRKILVEPWGVTAGLNAMSA